MADNETTGATTVAPTIAELEAKSQRLANQVTIDQKAVSDAEAKFASAVKSGNVEAAASAADGRTTAKATLATSERQAGTAASAITSAKYAQNAEKAAVVHDQMRDDKAITGYFTTLEALGVVRVVLERSPETGKLLVNSAGPTPPKKARTGGGGGGNGRGQSMTVDGQVFASASAAMKAFFPESGPLNRTSIESKLVNAGHSVS